jgi:hypothetical protein
MADGWSTEGLRKFFRLMYDEGAISLYEYERIKESLRPERRPTDLYKVLSEIARYRTKEETK